MLELINHISTFSSTSPPVGLDTQGNSLYVFVLIIAVIVTLRLYRGINGRAFSSARVLRTPVIYVILTLITVVPTGITDFADLGTLLLIPVGLVIGYRFGVNVSFFEQNGIVYYKRSQVIMFVWLVSLILRLVMEVIYPTSSTAILIVNILLTVTTGLVIGEAMNIIKKEKEFREKNTDNAGISP